MRHHAPPEISVIIPSTDGDRKGNVQRLRAALQKQTWAPLEIIVVVGVRPNGRARNVGAARARGDFLVFIDDDVRLGHRRVLEQLVKPFFTNPSLGMTGASQRIPPQSSFFQRLLAWQLPRSEAPFCRKPTESDMVTHACCCLKKSLFEALGGEDPDLIRGTDPDLRFRVRARSLQIKISPFAWVYHPVPASLSELLRRAFSNGRGAAWVHRTTPGKVYEAPSFSIVFSTIPFPLRVLRRLGSPFLSLAAGKWLKAIYDAVYGLGYLAGCFTPEARIRDAIF